MYSIENLKPKIQEDLFEWGILKGVEPPKFSTFEICHQLYDIKILSDKESTIKTDYVANWIFQKPRHSAICELINSRRIIVIKDYELLLNESNYQCPVCDNYPIHAAVLTENIQVINVLINYGNIDINASNANGETALHLACTQMNWIIACLLLYNGVDANIKDNSGIAPLHICVSKCDLWTTECLLKYGAYVDNHTHKFSHGIPLHTAIRNGYRSMINLLINYGADVNIRDANDQTPVYVAVKIGDDATLAELIKNNADVNIKFYYEKTSLFLACELERENCVRMLLEAGADANAEDCSEFNCLHVVASSNNTSMVPLLVKYGCDINKEAILSCTTPLQEAIKHNQLKMIEQLLRYGAGIGKTSYLLHYAVETNKMEVVKILLQNGVNVDAVDPYVGRTSLRVAVVRKLKNMVHFLLSEGANPNILDESKRPIIIEAICQNSAEIVRMLIMKGANLRVHDIMGKNPLHYAISQGNEEIITMLTETRVNGVTLETKRYLEMWENIE